MAKRPLRILLVEDHEDYYHLVEMMLSDHRGGPFSFELEWANTYQGGLQRMLLNQHDVYLIDHHLGRQHGLDLLRTALGAGCSAPMIMVTAEGDHHLDQAALKAGAAD